MGMASGFTLFIAAFCKIAAFNMTPFRAESGWFISRAWAGSETLDFIKPFLIKAYNGHFTPLFFGSEFIQARILGANDQAWFWRQMVVLGLLATSLSLLSKSVCAFTTLGRGTTNVVAAIFPLIFILQPTVLELASWPFMAAQLLCLACAAMSTTHALNLARTLLLRDATLSLAWAYGSMHLFGIGLTVSVTMLLLIAVIIGTRRLPRRFLWPVVTFAFVTCIHAFLMTTSGPSPDGAPQSLGTSVERFGALYMGSIQSGARSLWANGRFPWPNPATYSVDAVYGIALMSCSVVIFSLLLWRARRLGRMDLLASATLLAMPTLTLPLYCGLVVLRLHTVADPNALSPYLFGTRYVVFPAFFLFVALLIALPAIGRALGRLLVVPLTMFAVGAGAATFAFFTSVQTLWPYMAVHPGDEWNNVVSQARAELAAHGYVHDRPMTELDPELHRNLSEFRGLLEAELGCLNCVKFSAR